MTPEALTPCTCRVVVTRDSKTLLSRGLFYVSATCPHHGTPVPKGKP